MMADRVPIGVMQTRPACPTCRGQSQGPLHDLDNLDRVHGCRPRCCLASLQRTADTRHDLIIHRSLPLADGLLSWPSEGLHCSVVSDRKKSRCLLQYSLGTPHLHSLVDDDLHLAWTPQPLRGVRGELQIGCLPIGWTRPVELIRGRPWRCAPCPWSHESSCCRAGPATAWHYWDATFLCVVDSTSN